MTNFLLIYIAVLVAFSDAYYILFRNNVDEDGLQLPLLTSFWESFQMVYMIPMGDFPGDFQSHRTNIGWIYFIIATMILNVMLLNLLVTIISESYLAIKKDEKLYIYFDLLNVINQNQMLYQSNDFDWHTEKYMFFTDPVEQDVDPLLEKINLLE
mmetsp:Transcript_24186/g.23769  ORF Transcript_24186/g.23769 Transcript_24186/m.23769 type:complete len:155 (-) Transcript_24186:207-671(-)|eukprot:CAMPEP_0170567138 /NCGR_PEP_ID=MMETSP0211-20121228/80287_1 /TAXON_ID=311385 /ORGANISM="Pseudokeronopsis sp., Strain OXSARD2" /LENGTH=154 /DNA_ID=CAMNT_0010888515 /DNA_START=2042 /DNA_END=2506 /DNA_ORIENTATION=-